MAPARASEARSWAIAGLSLALLAALASLALAAPSASAAIPWGAGCTSLPASGQRTSSTCAAKLIDGRAIAPPGAPTTVKQMIAAANQIDGRPYVWGGGHASWYARGYDCSGAVGYALHGANLLGVTMVSGQLADWGEAGVGRWVTVYANSQHVFMVVAGLRFDTRDSPRGVTGPRWHRASVDASKFVARHPLGL
jgi:cell wall-associated NlpC family hydrolase